MGFIFLSSGLLLGWSLGANDHGNIFGAAVQTRMVKFKYAAFIASVFVILGAMTEGSGASATLNRLGSVNAAGGAFTVALATAISVFLMNRIKIPVSTSQAIVGAVIGWNLFVGLYTDYTSLANMVTSWIVTPILAGIISIVLFFLFDFYLKRARLHLLKMDYLNRWGLLIFGAFGAYSLGANNIANVVGIFIPVSPFRDVTLFHGLSISGISQLFFCGALFISVGIYTYSRKVMSTVSGDLFKLSPVTALIVVISESIVLFLFGSKSLQTLLLHMHLPPIPLVPISSSQAVIGAVMGVGIAKGGRNIHYDVLGKVSLAWVTSPVIAGILSFVMLFVVQNVFEQPVQMKTTYIFDRNVLMEMNGRGIDLDHATILNGHQYLTARALKSNLDLITQYNHKEKLAIMQVAAVDKIRIDYTFLRSQPDMDRFSAEQWDAIKKLDGKSYLHDWQLQYDLSRISVSWMFRVKGYKNQVYNNDLSSKYKMLYANCKIKKHEIPYANEIR
ncbi:MAG TPA: inorganic phosphate transporter [Candidatus Cloacimonadota bacterium]|nr:inorganic phosphate transporter [Candidatus Cloacimonadota bacterium]HPT72718.1 inorganic phosphate transporter [Candidatus Cloacimonadota bacterium]